MFKENDGSLKDYPTLKYLDVLGCDIVSLGRHQVKNVIFNILSDYQLKIYHHDIMKRPFNMFDTEGVKNDIYNNYLNEISTLKSLDYELVSDREFKEEKENQKMHFICLMITLAFIMVVVGMALILGTIYLDIMRGGF